jgi:transposase
VRVVCIDLSNSYRAIVKRWFPNALIVADRFHAVRIACHHLFKIARQVYPSLGWHRGHLGLLRTRHDRLEAEGRHRLKQLFQTYPALENIHALKERICRLLGRKMQSKGSCRRLIPELTAILQTLRASGFEAALTLAKTLSDWTAEIARMWRFSRNNGITEGFHRKMKLIQRRAYGFRSFSNYRLRVIAQCG